MNERERLVELLNKSWQFYFCEFCGQALDWSDTK